MILPVSRGNCDLWALTGREGCGRGERRQGTWKPMFSNGRLLEAHWLFSKSLRMPGIGTEKIRRSTGRAKELSLRGVGAGAFSNSLGAAGQASLP